MITEKKNWKKNNCYLKFSLKILKSRNSWNENPIKTK